MNTLLYCLLIFFIIVLILLLWIYFYRPQKGIQHSNEIVETEQEDEPIDYQPSLQSQLQEIYFLFPSLVTCMDRFDLPHAILMHWKGYCPHTRSILLCLMNQASRKGCLQAIEEIYEKGSTPANDFYILLPNGYQYEAEASHEACTFLKNHGIHISGVLSEGSDIEYLCPTAKPQALVGTSMSAYCEITIEGNGAKKLDWLESVGSRTMFPIHFNERIQLTLQQKYQDSFLQKVKLQINPTQMMEAFLKKAPRAWIWTQASLERTKQGFLLRAPNEEMLMEAYNILNADASKFAIYLKKSSQRNGSNISQPSDWFYGLVENTILHTFSVKEVLPVCINESGTYGSYQNWCTVRFSPFVENKKESPATVILFYQNLLLGSK